MKACVRCSRDRPLYAFTKDRTRADGLFPWCAECKSEARKEAYLLAHPERVRRAEAAQAPDSSMVYKFKLCIDCLEEKPISHFHRKRDAKDGRTPYCKPCGNVRSSVWQAANKERIASSRRAWRQKSPRQSLGVSLHGALGRRPTENAASLDQLMVLWAEQEGRCAVSGIAMTWAQGTVLPTSVTLDRKDAALGYTIENIRLVCHAVNSFRGRMSDDEMFTMARVIVARADAKIAEPTWRNFHHFMENAL